MKKMSSKSARLTASALSLTACVACTQAPADPPKESTGTSQEKLGEVGCGTVALHPPQQGGAGNDGLVDTGLAGVNCASGRVVATNASYPGDPSCPGQAIYELDDATGTWNPGVYLSGPMPTDASTCGETFVEYGVYAYDAAVSADAGSPIWDLLGTKISQFQWNATTKTCNYGQWSGNAPYEIDMSKYSKIRIAGSAFQGIAKANPLPITYLPVSVWMVNNLCIW